jgi:AcrR family transcriptional regulator
MERLPRKEREKLARREVILEEARKIFAQKGLHETTLDEIAERCELAKGTLYGYFESKEDLFFSVLEEAIRNVERVITQAAGSGQPPPEKISDMVKTMMVLFDENVDLMQLMTRNQPGVIMSKMRGRMMSHFRNLLGLVSGVIRDGVEQGFFRPTDTDRAAAAFFNLIHGNAMNSFWQNKRICNPKDLEFVTSFLFNGLSDDKHRGDLKR